MCVYIHTCILHVCSSIKLRQRKAKNGEHLQYNAHLCMEWRQEGCSGQGA